MHFPREQAYEGKYVIQTEEPNLSAVEAVRLYKELSEVDIDQTWLQLASHPRTSGQRS